jgi:hypothetical protein
MSSFSKSSCTTSAILYVQFQQVFMYSFSKSSCIASAVFMSSFSKSSCTASAVFTSSFSKSSCPVSASLHVQLQQSSCLVSASLQLVISASLQLVLSALASPQFDQLVQLSASASLYNLARKLLALCGLIKAESPFCVDIVVLALCYVVDTVLWCNSVILNSTGFLSMITV